MNELPENKNEQFFHRVFSYLGKNAKDIIYVLMIGFMIVAAGAYWLGAAFRHNKEILFVLYAASIVITFVTEFAKVFEKKYTTWVILITLTLMFLLAWLRPPPPGP